MSRGEISKVYEKTAILSSWKKSPKSHWFDEAELRVLVASENMRHYLHFAARYWSRQGPPSQGGHLLNHLSRLLWLLITSYCVWGAFLYRTDCPEAWKESGCPQAVSSQGFRSISYLLAQRWHGPAMESSTDAILKWAAISPVKWHLLKKIAMILKFS